MKKRDVKLSDTYFTPTEVAGLLKVTKQAVYNWITEGRLKAVRAGRAMRISRESLEEFLEPVEPGEGATDIESE